MLEFVWSEEDVDFEGEFKRAQQAVAEGSDLRALVEWPADDLSVAASLRPLCPVPPEAVCRAERQWVRDCAELYAPASQWWAVASRAHEQRGKGTEYAAPSSAHRAAAVPELAVLHPRHPHGDAAQQSQEGAQAHCSRASVASVGSGQHQAVMPPEAVPEAPQLPPLPGTPPARAQRQLPRPPPRASRLASAGPALPDKTLHGAFEPPKDEVAWAQPREALFHVYRAMDFAGEMARQQAEREDEQVVRVWLRTFTVEVVDLRFDPACAAEGCFCALALYQANSLLRASEEFHFDCAALAQQSKPKPKALFTALDPSQDTVLVLRVSRALRGPLEDALDSLSRPQAAQKLEPADAEWRQVVCWGYIPLFADAGEKGISLAVGDIAISPLIKHVATSSSDPQFLQFVFDPDKRKAGAMPGRCVVRVTETADRESVPGLVSSSLQPLTMPAASGGGTTQMVQEFADVEPVIPFYMDYRNCLYIYPESVNLSKLSGKNIAIKVQMLPVDNKKSQALQAVLNSTSGLPFDEYTHTAITYHSKTPIFVDEIKLAIPPNFSPQLHVLFTFVHVNMHKKKEAPASEILGYSFMPVFTSSNTLTCGDIMLPVAADLPDGYVSLPDSAIKYIDSKAALFRVVVRPMSTVFPTDKFLLQFFLCQEPTTPLIDLRTAMENLSKVHARKFVRWLPVIFHELLRAMCKFPEISPDAFAAFVNVLDRLDNEIPRAESNEFLDWYVKHAWVSMQSKHKDFQTDVHDEICKNWVHSLLGTLKCNVDSVNKLSWFFFQLVNKSVVCKAYADGAIGNNDLRPTIVSTAFYDSLGRLLSLLRHCAQQHVIRLNKFTATFIRDLFAVADRGRMLQLMRSYVAHLLPQEDPTIAEYRFEFMKLICEYEHAIVLNLPIRLPDLNKPKPSDGGLSFLKPREARGFLASVLLEVIEPSLLHTEAPTRRRAMKVVRDVLLTHDVDCRFQKPAVKAPIAALYIPLLRVLCAKYDAVITDGDEELRRDALISVIWVVKNAIGTPDFDEWLRTCEPRTDVERLCLMLREAIRTFCTLPDGEHLDFASLAASIKRKSSPMIGASVSMMNIAPQVVRPESVTLRPHSLQMASVSITPMRVMPSLKVTPEQAMEPALPKGWPFDPAPNAQAFVSQEVALSAVSAVDRICTLLEPELLSASFGTGVVEAIAAVFKEALEYDQSAAFYAHVYSAMRRYFSRFASMALARPLCGDIMDPVLRHCNCTDTQLRSEATAFTCFLLRLEFESKQCTDFSAMREHASNALSHLASVDHIEITNELPRAFATIPEYAKKAHFSDKEIKAKFAAQCQELVSRLSSIAIELMSLDQCKGGPEVTADLYHQVVQRFKDAPGLHLAWLDTLSSKQFEYGNVAESAICIVHMAAYVSEYLQKMEPRSWLPRGCDAFLELAPNAADERVKALPSVKTEADMKRALPPEYFSTDGLMKLIDRARSLLRQSDLHELDAACAKLCVPILEHRKDWGALKTLYTSLSSTCDKIIASNEMDNRHLGMYYRVGFYGKKMGTLHGKEWVYKEPKLTRLVEIKDRLSAQIREELQCEVIIITDTAAPDAASLASSEDVHIHLTKVDPLPLGVDSSSSQFDRGFGASRFVFDTPFTPSGKKQTDVIADQWKRKTFLHTERPLPWVVKRVAVVKREEVVLEPIEVSIEILDTRSEQMWREIKAREVRLRMLQALLQGSCLPTVNQGPREIVKTFLVEGAAGPGKEEALTRLRKALRGFLDACHAGLHTNSRLMKQDQGSFQNELLLGYSKLVKEMEPYLPPPTDADSSASAASTLPSDSGRTPGIVECVADNATDATGTDSCGAGRLFAAAALTLVACVLAA
eukprot:m51a1_g9726 putative dedicator of cytokinesis protein 6 (1846) ;mRNA; f:1490692-1498721